MVYFSDTLTINSPIIMLYLLGEPLGKYHKIETLNNLNIYISAYQAIIRSLHENLPIGSPNKYEHVSPRTYARIIQLHCVTE